MRNPIRFIGPGFLISLFFLNIGGAIPALAYEESSVTLDSPGYVIIEAGLDSTLGFQWHLGPGPAERSLTWAFGVLNLPDSLAVESLREVDLVIPCKGSLAGLGHEGQLLFQDGIYEISEPIFLSDGVIQLYLADGILELQNQRVRYSTPSNKAEKDSRAGYLFLGGMVLLVLVLLRRAALKSRNQG